MTITQQRIKELLNYDPETGDFTRIVDRQRFKAGEKAGYTHKGYVRISVDQKEYLAHRLAWLYVHGKIPKFLDHINGLKDDNRIQNLREATHSQNMMNAAPRKTNKSGYKGVSYCKVMSKWRAQIQVDKKKITLGHFDDVREAAEEYIFAALELHGDYTRIT